MTKSEIQKIAQSTLSDHLHESGSILYSSHETLKPGSVYLLGHNPGGSGGRPLHKSVESMLSRSESAYLDEEWGNKKVGEASLQKRICWLFGKLGLETREVCASNLIFLQSQAAIDIDFNLADKCWSVHKAILEIVQPKLIIAFGNSAYSPYKYLHKRFGGKEESTSSGHGTWKIKGFHCHINGRPVYVAGLPHLSRYSPEGKLDVKWLAQHLA